MHLPALAVNRSVNRACLHPWPARNTRPFTRRFMVQLTRSRRRVNNNKKKDEEEEVEELWRGGEREETRRRGKTRREGKEGVARRKGG